MGINIYYSAKQSKSPLYSKQVPYNSIIYKAFGQENPDSGTDDEGQRSGTKKRVAGSWCGKVWMSNQVHPLLAREREEHNHDMVYSKAMFSATSYDKIQEETSTRSATVISQSLSKRISRRKEGGPVEKSRAKKKRCAASDEATLHRSGIVMISETTHDQPRYFGDHVKHEDEVENEEASNTQQRQHELQSINKKSSSKRRKDDKRNNFHDLQDEKYDVGHRLDIVSIENTTVGDWDNNPQQGLDIVKVKSGVKLQGSKKKTRQVQGKW
uniref:Uncharacterized protein n=1 Tax=Arundo donax TaxID=35708 RepID=A0A0A9E779_ARUDO